jgi:hypothetical protein
MNWRAIAGDLPVRDGGTFRTLAESVVSPVLSTSLYFVVFGAAIGSRIDEVEGVSYGAFIVPGLIMLTVMTQSISNASFGIYFPKFIGTIYELLSAPVSFLEIVRAMSGGGDQGADDRADHPRDVVLLRRPADRASGLDGGLPRADLPQLQRCSASSSASGRGISSSCSWCRCW